MNWIDIALVGLLVACLASSRVSPMYGFLSFITAVTLLGRLPFNTVLNLLADPSLIAVICLVLFSNVLSRIGWIRRLLFSHQKKAGVRRTLGRFLGVTSLVSSVVPNTAVVGAFMGSAANHPRHSPHYLLMPLSYGALAAGMMTPFGTSANLIVVGQAAREGISLGLDSFLLPGLASVILVVIVLVLAAPVLLRKSAQHLVGEQEFFHVEARVPPGSPLIGRSVLENHLRNLGRFFLAEVMRGDRILSPIEPTEVLQEGDILVFVGDVRYIIELESIDGLEMLPKAAGRQHENILHAIVAAHSSLIGQTLKEAQFRSRFDASVFAIRRGNARLSGKLGEIHLEAGDLLVLAAGYDFAARDDIRGQLHVVETSSAGPTNLPPKSAALVSAGFGIFLLLAFTEAVPFALATLLLLFFALAGKWLSERDVKRTFPFELVVMLWGSLVLGTLIAHSGLGTIAAKWLLDAAPEAGPVAALVMVFTLTWILTEILSNVSAALAALPVAVEVARLIGAPPDAFALTVAFGASASFLVPFGYQTHLMVMTAGGYTLTDFLRMGSLTLLAYTAGSLAMISFLYF